MVFPTKKQKAISKQFNGIMTQIKKNKSEEQIKSYLDEIKTCSYDMITLLFSCHLAKLQQGNIKLKGTPELGYRFEVNIPTTPHHLESH